MDVSITIKSDVPAGTSLNYRGGAIPSGYLLEDGSLISRVTYARLFEAIGTTYGVGDGSTTFKLPDSRGRVDVASGTGSSLSSRTLAAIGGEENHTLTQGEMPSHTHTQNAHSHSGTGVINGTNGATGSNKTIRADVIDSISSTDSCSVGITTASGTATNQNTGGGSAHNNMQPYLVAHRIIKF